MKKILFAFFVVFICFSAPVLAQIPTNILVQIVKAEDERRYDKTLQNLIKNVNPKIRARAILAAGRIGDERAIPALAPILNDPRDAGASATAAFALGEIESINGADAILKALTDVKLAGEVKARTIEAAGKIAAANPKEAKSKELGEAILDALEAEDRKGKTQNKDFILLGLTAILRVRPEDGDFVTAKFLTNLDARIRANAANTLARLRSKKSNDALRAMLLSDDDAVARANAARALGAAEDKEAFTILLEAAVEDEDLRVRISAIRALGSLKDARGADKLLARGEKLLIDHKRSKFANPTEKNELLEIVTTLGRILPNSNDDKALEFLKKVREADRFISSETEIAFVRVAPKMYLESLADADETTFGEGWQADSAVFQGLGEIAALEANAENDLIKSQARVLLVQQIGSWVNLDSKTKAAYTERLAIPDLVRAFAAFKSDNTSNIFRPMLETEQDIFIRAAIAEVLGEQKPEKENVEALKKAFEYANLNDKDYNDASLAIFDAIVKLDRGNSILIFIRALSSKDYLIRKKALDTLKAAQKEWTIAPTMYERAVSNNSDRLFPYSSGSKLGVILNSNADYVRAVSRKNGKTKAVFTTEKGVFTIDLLPEDAPLTVDNFIRLARSKYFDGLAVHRVVPNFVMQDGDPRGDGNGGPGWEIRCEMNMLSYERGAVGMALSGKDTGGSQWFVTHSPQPHLDGGYTIFGRVNAEGMKIVDSIVRGDKILSVKIVE